jgi:hypothetical protein
VHACLKAFAVTIINKLENIEHHKRLQTVGVEGELLPLNGGSAKMILCLEIIWNTLVNSISGSVVKDIVKMSKSTTAPIFQVTSFNHTGSTLDHVTNLLLICNSSKMLAGLNGLMPC